jgi:hypothetical protein
MKEPIGNAPDCATGALIGLHRQKNILNNSDCRWGLIQRPEFKEFLFPIGADTGAIGIWCCA